MKRFLACVVPAVLLAAFMGATVGWPLWCYALAVPLYAAGMHLALSMDEPPR